jgi:hypothetical protein
LSYKIIIFKTFYYRGEKQQQTNMDLSKLLNIGENNKEDLTKEEIQALYVYLSMQFENMNDQQKLLWIEAMKSLDPEFDDYEKD